MALRAFRPPALLLIVMVLVAGGCSDGDDATGDETTASTTATTATTAPVRSLFVMPESEIAATFETATDVAVSVAEGLDTGDSDLYRDQFAAGARVTDPLVPSLKPTVGEFFSSFRALCSSWGHEEVFVNEGGSLTRISCSGYYDGIAGPPPSLDGVRHLTMENGLATGLMHRLDAATMGSYPEETVAIIGFPDIGMMTVDQSAVEQVEQANDFQAALVEAWSSGDHEFVAALYADDAIRQDEFAGLGTAPHDFTPWLETLYDTYDTVLVTVEQLYASGLGPAAFYRLEITTGGETCTMRIGSIWNLNADDLITYEQVFYDPDTALNCDWGP